MNTEQPTESINSLLPARLTLETVHAQPELFTARLEPLLEVPENRFVDLLALKESPEYAGDTAAEVINFCIDEHHQKFIGDIKAEIEAETTQLSPDVLAKAQTLNQFQVLAPDEHRRRVSLLAWYEYVKRLLEGNLPEDE